MKFETKLINLWGNTLQIGNLPAELIPVVGDLQNKLTKGVTLEVEVKVKRKNRSKDANAMCWALAHSIADKLYGHDDEDIYRQAIRQAGVKDYVVMKEEAYERFDKDWSARGIGCFTERLREAKGFDGWCTVTVYYGSSQYDTAQMAKLIDYLIDEAKRLGCDVISPSDRALLLDDWEAKMNGRSKVD